MKTKLAILFVSIVTLTQISYANADSDSAKADIKVTKIECLKEGHKAKGYIATAQVKKALEGNPGSEVKIFFDTKKKDGVSFLEGDEAAVTLHKESKYWVVKSPEDKKGSVFSSGILPTCY
jgi:hypothetical protein